MKWLQDIAAKQKQERQAEIQEHQRKVALFTDMLREVSPTVNRLLSDVGTTLFGSSWLPWGKNYLITQREEWCPACFHEWSLSRDSQASGRLTVQLWFSSFYIPTPHFKVQGDGDDIITKDTSEAELKQALRTAVERGLRYPSDYAYGV